MTASKMNDCIDATIPTTAKEIKVTNIYSPYFIRALDVIEDDQKKKELSQLLETTCKHYIRRKDKDYLPKVDDHVVVSTTHLDNSKVDLPSWFCRGTVVDACSTTADVFFVDYGIVVNVPNVSIARYPQSAIPIEPQSYTLGIYNILPLDSEKNVFKSWPKYTVDLVKELIQTSKKIYFEILTHDKNTNRVFGDLYLVINNRNLCLSKFLIESHMAIALDDELMQAEKKCKSGTDLAVANTYAKQNNNISSNMNQNHSTSSENKNNFSKPSKRLGNSKKLEILDKILIHSKVSCYPLEHLVHATFATNLHKALTANGVSKLKKIQSYMWPAIKQGLNVTTIAPPSSGKTLGYVVPILNAIAANKEMVDQQKSEIITKPFVLVLCATLSACIDVATAFNTVAQLEKNIKCCAFVSGMDDKELMTRICNKFQVVVSTPSFLLRLLSKDFASNLNVSELSYVVLDHADVILHKYLKEVITLIKDYKIINKDFTNCIQGASSQIVIVARTWTSEIDSFVSNFMENSYTCIGSFTEAAAYNGVRGRMLIRHSDKKKYEVLEAIKDYATQKTLIFCLDSTEACELNRFLLTNDVRTLLVHDDMEITQIDELKDDLKTFLPGMFPAIICTDEVLSEFPVSDVEYLIHYSVTHTSKSQFNRRFSVLMDNWSLELGKKCKILILFDETKDSVHFKGVVDILKRFKVDLPEDWNVIADGLEIQDNIKKKNYPLCNNIKSFGYCNTAQSCSDRHRVIAETDAPQIPEISIGDDLKLLVTYIHSVTHYSARVLECTKGGITNKDKKVLTLPHNIGQLSIKLKSYYTKIENRRAPKEITPGLICVAKINESYARVKILKITENHANSKPRAVKIQSMDDGCIKQRISVTELYEISDEFLNYKLPIVNIYLTGVSPFDEENEWGDLANVSVLKWFEKNQDAQSHVCAKVLLHIDDSIWTDSLIIRSKILGYSDLVSSSLKKNMIDQEHGIDNKKHLPHLIHLCLSSGITEINGQPIELPKDGQEQKH